MISGVGTKTGTWYKFSGLNYIVSSSPEIDDTLTIDAGNTLKFEHSSYFKVDGTLIATGTNGNEITFTRNDATDEWAGLRFHSGSTGILDHCIIEYGTHSSYYGVYANAADSIKLNNCILQNNYYGFYGQNCDPDFTTNNQILNNEYGIYLADDCTPVFGSGLAEWNDICSNSTYNLRNGDNDITAEYVYWGTTSQGGIESKIYHSNDNSSLGTVDFTPWINATHDSTYTGTIDTPQNVVISISSDSVNITWDTVAGATSYKVYSSDNPYTGFTEDTSGSFAGTSWTAPLTVSKKFYYVKAVN